MANILNRRKQMQRAREVSGPMLYTQSSTILGQRMRYEPPIIPSAMGDLLPLNLMLERRQRAPWISRILAAQLLNTAFQAGNTRAEDPDIQANLWFQLCGTWSSPPTNDLAAMENQAARLDLILKTSPPHNARVANALTAFFQRILAGRAAPPVGGDQLALFWANYQIGPGDYSAQYHLFGSSYAHSIPWDTLINLTPEARSALAQLCRPTNPDAPTAG